MNSPFADRKTIDDPSRFFGREKEKRDIFNALAAPQPQCVAIIGDKRIGRSSLLKNIEQTYHQHLPNPSRYHFAYLDAQDPTCSTPNSFYAEVAQAFFNVREKALDHHDFNDLLHDKNPDGTTKFILLLDEFNTLQRRKHLFNDDFYDGLRARANSGMLTYVLASHIGLEEIAVEHEFGSTFFGIFAHVALGKFDNEEARASILRPATPQLTSEDFGRIARLQKESYHPMASQTYHPLKLNIGADLVWKERAKGVEPNFTEVAITYNEQVEKVFGESVKKRRRRTAHKNNVVMVAKFFKGAIEWLSKDKRYLFFALLLIALLVCLGYLTQDQLLNWTGLQRAIPTQ